MAKVQSFADKAKKKRTEVGVNVKVVRGMKTEKGSFKFTEKFVRIDDVAKVTEIK